MPATPTTDERIATDTTPLPQHRRSRRLVMLYALLALIAIVIGIAIGAHRHGVTTPGAIAAPTEQSLIATAPTGVPTPTPLATKPPTAAPPTVPPPTVAPPPPIPLAAPAANGNRNDQHGDDNDGGKGNGKDKGD